MTADNMGTLLSRMTRVEESDFKLDDSQVTAVVEVMLKKIVEAMPGMPQGMRCTIVEKDDSGWTLRVERPR